MYIINGNGEYASGLSDVFGDYDNNPKVEKKGIYYVYNGTTQEAAEENIDVAKKAVTIDGSDSNVYSDLEWHQYGNIWAAYREVDGEMLQTGEQDDAREGFAAASGAGTAGGGRFHPASQDHCAIQRGQRVQKRPQRHRTGE